MHKFNRGKYNWFEILCAPFVMPYLAVRAAFKMDTSQWDGR